jgi:hypothetical protein
VRRSGPDEMSVDEARRRAVDRASEAIELTRRDVVEQVARKRAAALAAHRRGYEQTASPTATTPPSSTSP